MEMSDGRSLGKKKCGCPCHKITGVFLVLFGVTILVNCFGGLGERAAWIVVGCLMVLYGLAKIGASCCRCCDRPSGDDGDR